MDLHFNLLKKIKLKFSKCQKSRFMNERNSKQKLKTIKVNYNQKRVRINYLKYLEIFFSFGDRLIKIYKNQDQDQQKAQR